MGILDIIILVLVAAGVVHGYRTGFFKQAGGIAGVLIGFAMGVGLMNSMGAYLIRITGLEPALGPILGFIAVFAGTYLLIQVLAKVGQELLGAAKLTFVNRIMGGGVGGLKAGLLVSVAFLGLAYVELPPESARTSSTLYHSVAAIMPAAWGFVMDNSDSLDELSERIERVIPEGEDGAGTSDAGSESSQGDSGEEDSN